MSIDEPVRVGLMNFHFAHNYGAVLQCLALRDALQSLGLAVEVIDYEPYSLLQYDLPYPSPIRSAYWRYRRLSQLPRMKRGYQTLRWMVCTVFSYRHAPQRRMLRKAFSPFVAKHLQLSARYGNLSRLRRASHPYAVFVCGSDQLWNPETTGGIDPAYYLDFGDPSAKRIAYAVSPCGLDVRKHRDALAPWLSAFHAISLRENEKKDDLQTVYGGEIKVCVDPTLLPAPEAYQPYEEPIADHAPYILTYAFGETSVRDWIPDVLETVRTALQYPVIDVSFETIGWKSPVTRRFAVTPGQFLTYCRNAVYVVTNSFHGTAFSILYQRDFTCVAKKGTECRMRELLERLNLRNRLMLEKVDPIDTSAVDYRAVDSRLSALRVEGLDFLRRSIGMRGEGE